MDVFTLFELIIIFCSGIIIPIVIFRYKRKGERKKHKELMKAYYEMIKTFKQQRSLAQNQNLSSSEVDKQRDKLQRKAESNLLKILKTIKTIGWLSNIYEKMKYEDQNNNYD